MTTPAIRVQASAVTFAAQIAVLEITMLDYQQEIQDLRHRVNQLERPYRLQTYPGKNQATRDAQMDDDMELNDVLTSTRSLLAQAERKLVLARINRDEQERFYKIDVAFLRTLSNE